MPLWIRPFAEEFGAADALEYFSAPGRTEIGGNHTDHNHGKVLAAAVNLDVIAAVKKTGQRRDPPEIRRLSDGYGRYGGPRREGRGKGAVRPR